MLFLMIFPSLLWANGRKDDSAVGSDLSEIFVSNYPLYFAAESIMARGNPDKNKDMAELLWLFPDDVDPAFWEPEREDLAALQAADLLLFNGADYEKWSRYAFLDESRICDSSAVFGESFIVTGEEKVHSHGGGSEHSHGGTAFTLWLDLKQYGQQIRSVKDALIDLLPDQEDLFRKNTEKLLNEVNEMDQAFVEAGAPFRNMTLLASHPIYQYFARAYLGDLIAMLWEPDLYPPEEEWEVLENALNRNDAGFMLWEDEPLPETRERLEAMGLELVIVKPGFSMPESGNFTDILKSNLDELKRAGNLR